MAMTYIAPNNGSKIGYCYDAEQTGTFNGYPYKGVITAIMKGTKHDAQNKIDDFGNRFGIVFINEAPEMKNAYYGTAYCSADDEFDLTEGMRIARKRLLHSYHKDISAAIDHCYPIAREFAIMLLEAELEHKNAADKNDNRSENYGKNA